MRKGLILILFGIALLSGCVGQPPSTFFKNDVITLEDYSVSSVELYANSITKIDFLVQSYADRDVRNVEVNFFDNPFEIKQIKCEGTEPIDNKKCVFDKIETMGSKSVSVTLQAPPPEKIKSPTTFSIRFLVKYDYTGEKRANIPIVDGVNRIEPKTTYRESSVPYAPIQLNFDPPVGKSKQEGDKLVKVYWGIKDQPFELGMNFKHVGSSTVGDIKPTIIDKGKVYLELDHLEVAPNLRCDFDQEGNQLISKYNVTVPGKLLCTLKPTTFEQMEVTAFVDATFDFTYEFRRTQSFKVLPLEKT